MSEVHEKSDGDLCCNKKNRMILWLCSIPECRGIKPVVTENGGKGHSLLKVCAEFLASLSPKEYLHRQVSMSSVTHG